MSPVAAHWQRWVRGDCPSGLDRLVRVFVGPMAAAKTTSYWLKMARHGYVNGFYYPLVYQEHMDDTRSVHSHFAAKYVVPDVDTSQNTLLPGDAASMQDDARYHRAAFLNQNWHRHILDNLLNDPFEPCYYTYWLTPVRATYSPLAGSTQDVALPQMSVILISRGRSTPLTSRGVFL